MKYFTKSNFKLSLDCPTKLYYKKNSAVYANSSVDDPFIEALAQGGFQVGALAKCYYPDGIEIHERDHAKLLAATEGYLKESNIILFEPAFAFKNLFARVDILEKKGKKIKLIEVKSKTVDPKTFKDEIWKVHPLKQGIHEMKGDWMSELYDIAFQAYVIKQSHPEYQVECFLMCPDSTKKTTIEGLNQKFVLRNKTQIEFNGDISPQALGDEILTRFDVTEVIDLIHADQEMAVRFEGKGFENGIQWLATNYLANKKIVTPVSKACGGCEFRCEDSSKNLKSGFKECWNLAHGLTNEEMDKPFVFDVWNFRGSDKALEADKFLMEDLEESDFSGKPSEKGLSQSERQWLQVERVKNEDESSYFDKKGLSIEFELFKYPIHMIDFETCMVAIPFNKDKLPYQQIAFQFSHHIIQDDGTSFHADEYISCTSGDFPNFQFVRALKKALEKDNGSIFRFSNHENTVLCQIHEQLQVSNEKDKKELCAFIESITNKKDKTSGWVGKRNMIDLCDLVKKYYYSPSTGGSNSIKYVLPAILNESEFLKEKYSKPFYNSKNFRNHQWFKFSPEGKVEDPYKTLPPIFQETIQNALMGETEKIANGGVALTAYAMMQFTQMTESERTQVRDALLRYCELDTLAMVMIFEHWNSLIKNTKKTKKTA